MPSAVSDTLPVAVMSVAVPLLPDRSASVALTVTLPAVFNPVSVVLPVAVMVMLPPVEIAPLTAMLPLALTLMAPVSVCKSGRTMGATWGDVPVPVCRVMLPVPWVLNLRLGALPLTPAPAMVRSMPRLEVPSVEALRVVRDKFEFSGRVNTDPVKDEAVRMKSVASSTRWVPGVRASIWF